MTDTIMAGIAAAVEQGRAGHPAQARDALTALWDRADDPLHRCSIAHYLADLQDDPEAELRWDERALAAVPDRTDARLAGFLPSLHLNLADVHRRLGHDDAARTHLTATADLLDQLPDGEYGDTIRAALTRVTALLAAGSRERLT